MGLTADMRLFARKGEAAPAGVGLSHFPTEEAAPVEAKPEETTRASNGSADAGGLSFLIHRRKPAATDEMGQSRPSHAPAPFQDRNQSQGKDRARPAPAGSKAARGAPPARTERQPGRAVTGMSAASSAPTSGNEAPETWHKLSFRVRNDQYRKLKALSGLWGASYQGILERAVAAFVDSAIGAEEADWDA